MKVLFRDRINSTQSMRSVLLLWCVRLHTCSLCWQTTARWNSKNKHADWDINRHPQTFSHIYLRSIKTFIRGIWALVRNLPILIKKKKAEACTHIAKSNDKYCWFLSQLFLSILSLSTFSTLSLTKSPFWIFPLSNSSNICFMFFLSPPLPPHPPTTIGKQS